MNEKVNLWNNHNNHSEEKEKIQKIKNDEFNKKAQNIKGSIVELTAQIENLRKNRRKEVEYILENLRRYELFVKNTHISEKDLEEYKKYFYGNLMWKDNGTLNFGDYSEIAKIVNAQKTTKDFLKIYYYILDSYIENEILPDPNSKSKQLVLKHFYGYKLPMNEKTKTIDEMIEFLNYSSFQSFYRLKNRLLEELVPYFFGIS